ncbi:VOC family protein [Thermoflavimicrobium daqui]|jgi:PhnB protein|uniref:Glyoxalase/fosfomycin resistance/dioxygenase domain-containing protein n=1 Tax=Thermoflavimicrobium daqui TaxID=2137476 RepID=A0A364K847_9BACL|nr:VOC family protein [Thermoflavimicrobium daqui]RAL26392.1 hypothetical protein DL897_05215 [Thermoflavimicrobium daqui]
MKINPYILLPENSEKAMNFYKEVFGGKIVTLQRYRDVPDIPCNEEDRDKLLHGHLELGDQDQAIYFSDMLQNNAITFGNQISLTLMLTSVDMIEKVFHDLSQDGKVLMPLQDTFWGAKYGKLIDQFGIYWDLNCPL